MRRREFLLGALSTASAAVLPQALRGAAALLSPAPAERSAIALGRGAGHHEVLRRAVAALGGPSLLARPGEQVLLKPVLAWNRAPREGANTQPEILRAAIELALEGGASRVTICDRTSLRAASVHSVSGVDRVVRAFRSPRVRLVEVRERDLVTVREAARSRGMKDFEARSRGIESALDALRVSKHVLMADRIVNLATVRHHPTRRVALGFSNLLGLVGGWSSTPRWLAQHDTELALLAASLRPELTILDATRPILSNGPAGLTSADVGRWDEIAVGRDPVAVEAWGARRFGVEPSLLGHIPLAEGLGLGSADTPTIIEV